MRLIPVGREPSDISFLSDKAIELFLGRCVLPGLVVNSYVDLTIKNLDYGVSITVVVYWTLGTFRSNFQNIRIQPLQVYDRYAYR